MMVLDLKDGWAVPERIMPTCSFPPEHLFAQPSTLPWAPSFMYIFLYKTSVLFVITPGPSFPEHVLVYINKCHFYKDYVKSITIK